MLYGADHVTIGNLTYVAVTDPDSGFWQAHSSSIIVNGQATINSSRLFLFDSGTSNMLMPKEDAEVSNAISKSANILIMLRSM